MKAVSTIFFLMASLFWNASFGAVSNFLRRGFGVKPTRVQSIYDSLVKINDWTDAVNSPLSSDEIVSCIDIMNQLNGEDIGIDSTFLSKLRYSVCMNICSTPNFNIALFIIPAGSGIPLHDHPNMTVLSKLVMGEMNIRSFSPVEAASVTNTFPAVVKENKKHTSLDPTWFLTPSEGNIHEFEALSGCVVFDILLPPYDDPERPCTYFRAEAGYAGQGPEVWQLTPTPPPRTGLPYGVDYRGPRPVLR